MTIRQAKRAMRRHTIASILAMEAGERERQQASLVSAFPTLPGFEEAATVLLYASAFVEEIDTTDLFGMALDRGKRVVCPSVDRERGRLLLFEIRDPSSDLEAGVLGIPEPRPGSREVHARSIDWALVPGVAFDGLGHRLGRGGGFYDRLLPSLRPETPRWALAFDAQWVDAVPVESHDQPLGGIFSPGREVILTR